MPNANCAGAAEPRGGNETQPRRALGDTGGNGSQANRIESYLSAINNTIASAEFSLTGKLVDANEIFLKVLGYGAATLRAWVARS